MKLLLKNLLLMVLAFGVFLGVLVYESNFSVSVAQKQAGQVAVSSDQVVTVNRVGEVVNLGQGAELQIGDIVESRDDAEVVLAFAEDGRLRLDRNSRLLIEYVDEGELDYVFKLLQGRAWLNNVYSGADVNLRVDTGLVMPSQSIVMLDLLEDRATVYSNQNFVYLNLMDPDYAPEGVIGLADESIINTLLLPEGTEAKVFPSKIEQNQDTIGRLLFSKLIKEFQYGVYDEGRIAGDPWLSTNRTKDQALAVQVKTERLERISDRGVKYEDLDNLNYSLDNNLRDFFNLLTISEQKVGERNLDALFVFLYDSQYFYAHGQADKAEDRLRQFQSLANQLLNEHGQQLRAEYNERVLEEFQYLSFVSPNDALFEMRRVLEGFYLEAIEGRDNELEIRFELLSHKIAELNFFAELGNINLVSSIFDDYMESYTEITMEFEEELADNLVLIQRQNQLLDGLFEKYASFYRDDFFRKKILQFENVYIDLLPEGNDKYEEVQTIMSQRIKFLRKLQEFYLNEQVSIDDARAIISLVKTETEQIELPASATSAVAELFQTRLAGFSSFLNFLRSPAYFDSPEKGDSLRERYQTYLSDVAAAGGDQDQEEFLDLNVEEEIEEPRVRVPRVRPSN